MNKKVLLIALAIIFIIGVIGIGVFIILSSQNANASGSTLGTQNSNNSGFGNTNTTDQKAAIKSAVSSGKLTQRQSDLLNAELDNMQNGRQGFAPNGNQQPVGNPPQQPSGGQSNFLQQIVDQLNEKGLNTTVNELEAANSAAQTAGIQVGFTGRQGAPNGERPNF